MIENINLNRASPVLFEVNTFIKCMKCIRHRKQNNNIVQHPIIITGHINFLRSDTSDSGAGSGGWDTCWVTFDTRTCVLAVWADEQEDTLVQKMDTTPATFLYDLEPGGHFKIW